MSYILIIVLSSGIVVPVADFDNKAECEKALLMWTLEPGVRVDCVPDDWIEMEPDARQKRRGRRR